MHFVLLSKSNNMADLPEKLTPEEMQIKFAEISALSIGQQAKHFLREFVGEISKMEDGFEKCLKLSDDFVEYTETKDRDSVNEMDEHKFHLFLEHRGEAQTVKDVRDAIRTIDLDSNMKISFIEYCLFNYGKTLDQLFEPKPFTSATLLKALDEAIALHEEVLRARKEEEDKIEDLTKLSNVGGVKGMKARVELEQMRVRSQTGQNMAEVKASFKKRQAERNLKNADPMAEEMKKLDLKKKEEEEAKKMERAASKRRLQDRIKHLSPG